MKRLLSVLVVASFVLCTAVLAVAASDDAAKAEALVKKGVEYFKSAGEEKAMEEFSNKKGQFVDGEFYLFMVDFTGVTTAHGGNPSLIGKNMKDLKDADGKLFIQAMIETAKGKGSGWVDYKWKNPKTGEVMPKSSYVERLGDAFLGCGIYKR
jgi:signal transduction histidine kinase